MIYNFLIFGFPIYLILFEILFRTFSHVDTSTFIGPTIGASGLSLLIPLVKPKIVKISDDELIFIKKNNLTLKYENDDKLIFVVWVSILIEIIVWYWSCSTSINTPKELYSIFPKHLCIGVINYMIGVLLTIIKDEI